MPLNTAYVAIGSNVGDRLAQMRRALELLVADGTVRILGTGRIYQNRAIGMGEADPFLNSVIQVETSLCPEALLDLCLSVEDQLGRVRTGVWAPRTMDLDVLIYGTVEQVTERLHLPHPRMQERDFVMLPLADLAPDLEVHGQRVCVWADSLGSDELQVFEHPLWTPPASALK